MEEDAFERKLYVVRKRVEVERLPRRRSRIGRFFISPRSRREQLFYKGLLLAPQIANFYGELADPTVTSALCLVHQRFSTNTFPSWQLAHPYRYVAHNGEISTVTRQRELDAVRGSRSSRRHCLATISRSCFPLFRRAAAIRLLSTTRWSCCCRLVARRSMCWRC